MRIFRIRQRLPKNDRLTGKHRDYLGEIKLRKFGKETYIRYNCTIYIKTPPFIKSPTEYSHYTAELCELKNDKWEVLSKEETKNLLEL